MPTPRPASAPDPGADQTVVLGARPVTGDGTAADRTVVLGKGKDADVAADRTVVLGKGADVGEATVRLPRDAATGAGEEDGAQSATFLDPRVWRSAPASGETLTLADPEETGGSVTPVEVREASPSSSVTPTSAVSPTSTASPERPLAPGELRRFGPGVPPRAAAAWHGQAAEEAGRPRRPRRVGRWLVPLLVLLLALAAFLFWRHLRTPALAVNGVAVTTDPAGPGCAGTAVVTAAVETNGGSGSLRYRWLRSDGTTSDEIVQKVRSGAHHTDLVLRWSFEGQGALRATATLELLSPTPRTAAVTFPYHCS